MKDNLHNDRLEEFLKNSLERHSEEPPADMWEKIEGGLDPAPAAPRRTFGWWWLVAAALLAGLFIGQYLYFSQKINKLSKQLEQGETKLEKLEKNGQTRNAEQDLNATTPPQAFDDRPSENGEIATDEQLLKPALPPHTTSSSHTPGTNDGSQLGKPPHDLNATASVLEQAEEKVILPSPVDLNDAATASASPVTKTSQLEFLPFKNTVLNAAITQPILGVPSFAAALSSAQQPGKFSLGMHFMPMLTREKITALRPNTPHPGRKVFNETSTNWGDTYFIGLMAEYRAAPRFYLGSGMDYRRTAISSSHRAELKFKDRRPHGGGPHGGHHEHDFQYDLNTSTGLVEIEVRAEQADTTLTLPDTEDVALNINTQQVLQYFSIPLYARYEMGYGKMRFFAKAGLIANFLLDSDFTITGIESQNPLLRFERKRQPKGVQQNLQTMSMDYLAGVGMDYALTPQLKFRLEPSLTGSLTSSHNNRFIQSSHLSLGMNAGLMYVF